MTFFPALHGLAAAIKQALQIPDDGTYSWLINQDNPARYWRLNGARWTYSPTGDDFTSTDKTFNQGYWIRRDYNVVQGSTSEIVNNKLELTVTSDVSNAALNYWSTTSAFVGDFDVEMEFEDFTRANANLTYLLFVAQIDGTLYDVGPFQEANGNRLWRTTFPGFQSYARTGDDGKIRITRVGTTLTAYTDHTGSWTARANTTVGTTPCYFEIRLWSWNTAPGLAEAKIVNFTINSHSGFVPYFMIDSNETVANGMNQSFIAKNPGAVEGTGLLFNDTNKAVTFDGVAQYARQGVSYLPMTDSQGTVELWVRFNSDFNTKSDGQILFSVCKEGSSDDRFAIWADSDGLFRFFFSPSGGSNNFNLYSLGDYLKHDQTYHIVVTSDGSTVRMFLNGFEQSTAVSTGTNSGQWLADMTAPTGVFLMAQDTGSPTGFTDGTADELAYYSRALDPIEIFQHYLRGIDEFVTPYEVVVEVDNPVHYWKMGGSVQAADYVGDLPISYVNGPQSGLAIVRGGDASTLFNGTDQYAAESVTGFRDTDTQGSIEAWVRSRGDTSQMIFCSSTSTTQGAENGRFGLYLRATGAFAFIWDDVGDAQLFQTDNTSFHDNHYHHVVLTSDGSTWRLYVDGVEESISQVAGSDGNTGNWYGDISGIVTDTLSIGIEYYTGSPVSFFNGNIDDVAYYDTALSPARVLAHYEAGIASSYREHVSASGPLAYWRLDETSGTTAYDTTGRYHGTYTNSPNLGQASLIGTGEGTSVQFTKASSHWVECDALAPAITGLARSSIELWFRTSWNSGVNNYDQQMFSAHAGSTNRIRSSIALNGGVAMYADGDSKIFGSGYNDGQSHHLVMVFKTNNAYCYVDGVFLGSQALAKPTYSDITKCSIGQEWDGSPSDFFEGWIDEVAFYGYALELVTVQAHYNAGIDPFQTAYELEVGADSPTHFWKLGSNGNDSVGGLTLSPNGTPSSRYPLNKDGFRSTYFDGSSDYYANFVTTIESQQSGTIEAWISTSLVDWQVIFGANDTASTSHGLEMYVRDTGYLYIQSKQSSALDAVYGDTFIADGKVHHVVATCDGATWKLYVDGAEETLSVYDGANTGEWFGDITGLDALAIGVGLRSARAYQFTGQIDDLALYNTALSGARVLAHYNAGVDNSYKHFVYQRNPIAYWKMDETSGTDLIDEGGNYNGTYTGSPTFAEPSLVLNEPSAVTFSGSGQYATVDSLASALASATALTIEVWFSSDASTLSPGGDMLFATNTATGNNGLLVHGGPADDPGYIQWRIYEPGQNNYEAPRHDVDDGLPHHVVVTWEGTEHKLYIDGVLQYFAPSGSSTWNDSITRVSLAMEWDTSSPGNYLNGSLDEVAVYNYRLTSAEIFENYVRGSDQFDTYDDVVVADSPASYWKLDHRDVAYDIIDSRHLVYAAGAPEARLPITANTVGQSRIFDGSTDYASGAHTFYATTAMSMEAWIRCRSNSGGYYPIGQYETNGNERRWLMEVLDGTIYAYFSADGTFANTLVQQSDTTYDFTVPRHLVCTFNAGTAKIYLDGAEIASTATNGTCTSLNNNNPNIDMGVYNSSSTPAGYFDGGIDNVAIYDYELSAARVLAHYNAGAPSTYVQRTYSYQPLAYWRLDDTAGTTAVDETGNYPLTYANSPALNTASILNGGGTAVGFTYASSHYANGDTDYTGIARALTQFSFEIWVNLTDNGQTYQQLWFTSQAQHGWTSIGCRISDDLKLLMQWRDVLEGTSYTVESPTNTFTYNETHHLVFVLNTDSNVQKIYMDGVEVASGTQSTNGLIDLEPDYERLGSGGLGWEGYPNGTLDEAALYDYALSAEQVLAHYNQGHIAPPSSSVTSYSTAMSKSAPYAWWQMGDQSGNFTDSSGNGRDITTIYSAPTYARPGVAVTDAPDGGYSVRFDGTDDYASLPFTLPTSTSHSIEAWFSLDDLVLGADWQSQKHLINWGDSLYVMIDNNGRLHAGGHDGDEYVWGRSHSALIDVSDKYHVVWVYKAGATSTLYVNGKEYCRVSIPASQGSLSEQSGTRTLGAGLTTRYWKGLIDDVAYYDRELSWQEVQEHYVFGGGTDWTPYWRTVENLNPEAYWRMGDGATTTAADRTGNHDATYSNSSTATGYALIRADRDKSATFTGTNWFTADSSLPVPGTGSWSISLWVEVTNFAATQFIMHWGNDTSSDEGVSLFVLGNPGESHGSLVCRVNASNDSTQRASTSRHVTPGVYHVVLVIDRDYAGVGGIRGYLDGENIGWVSGGAGPTTDLMAGFGSIDPPTDLTIGYQNGGSLHFTGRIDEVAVFQYALNPTQVRALHSGGLGDTYDAQACPYLPAMLVQGRMVGSQNWKVQDSARGVEVLVVGNSLEPIGSDEEDYDGTMVFDGATFLEATAPTVLAEQVDGVTGQITMTMWVKPYDMSDNTVSGNVSQLFAFPIDGVNTGFGVSASSERVYVGGRSVGTDSWQSADAIVHVPNNSWTHIAGVVDYANDEINIYINGDLVRTLSVTFANTVFTYGTPSASANRFCIGNNITSTGRYFKGEMRDVAVYNTGLAASEVRDIVNRTAPQEWSDDLILNKNPEGYWKLKDSSPGRFSDSSGYERDGWGPGDFGFRSRLLHIPMDGSDEGLTFTELVNSYPIVRYGNTHTEADEFVCGISSAYFDGAGDFLAINNYSAFDLTNTSTTIECWFWIEEWPADGLWGTLIGQHFNTTGWRLLYDDDRRLHFSTNAGATNGFFTPKGVIKLQTWHHVAATYNPTTQESICFLDGKKVATKANCSWTHNTTALRIGSTDGSAWFHKGYIDELKIYTYIKYVDDFNPRAQIDLHRTTEAARVQGIVPTSGQYSMYLNGAVENVTSAWMGNEAIEADVELTVECWAKSHITSTGSYKTLAARYGSNSVNNKRLWWFGVDTDNKLGFIWSDAASGTDQRPFVRMTAGLTSIGRLHHYVVVFNRGTVRLYVDGVLKTIEQASVSKTLVRTLKPNRSVPVTIGSHHDAGVDGDAASTWTGSIQNLAVYNTAFTHEEVNHHFHRYDSGTPFADSVKSDYPVHYVRMHHNESYYSSSVESDFYEDFRTTNGRGIGRYLYGGVNGVPDTNGTGISLQTFKASASYPTTAYTVSGDFEAIINFDFVKFDANDHRFYLTARQGSDHFSIYREHDNGRTTGTDGTTYENENGMVEPHWFRIRRVTNTVYLEWKVNEGDSWTTRSTFTDHAGNPEYYFQTYADGTDVHVKLKLFTLNADGYSPRYDDVYADEGERPFDLYQNTDPAPTQSTMSLTKDGGGSVVVDSVSDQYLLQITNGNLYNYMPGGGGGAWGIWHAFKGAPDGSASGLFSKGYRSDADGGYTLVYNPQYGLQFLVDDGTTQVVANEETNTNTNRSLPPYGSPQFAVGVYDSTKQMVEVWRNGYLIDRVSMSTLNRFSNTLPNTTLGGYTTNIASAPNSFFNGAMSDFVTFDYVPEPGRIRAYWEAGQGENHETCIRSLRPDVYVPLCDTDGNAGDRTQEMFNTASVLNGTFEFNQGRLAPSQHPSEKSMLFNGTDTYVELASAPVFASVTGEYTVSLLVNLKESTGDFQYIFGVGENGEFSIYFNKDFNDFRLSYKLSDASWYSLNGFEEAVQYNRTYHIVVVFSAEGGYIQLYVNGRRVGNRWNGNLKPFDPNSGYPAIRIGRQYADPARYTHGRIQHVAYWNSSLPPAAIEKLFLSTGLPTHEDQAEYAYYPMDQKGGETVFCRRTLSNYQHQGTASNITRYREKPLAPNSKGSMYFDADPLNTSYIALPTDSGMEDLYNGNYYTVECWFEIEDYPAGTPPAWDSAYMLVAQEGYHNGLRVYANGALEAVHWATGPTNWYARSSSYTVIPGRKYHVLMCVNKLLGRVALYLNGQKLDAKYFVAADAHTNTNPWRIGCAIPDTGGDYAYPFRGWIEGVKFSRVMVADESVVREYRKLSGTPSTYLESAIESSAISCFTFSPKAYDLSGQLPVVKDGELNTDLWDFVPNKDGTVQTQSGFTVKGDKLHVVHRKDDTVSSGSNIFRFSYLVSGDFDFEIGFEDDFTKQVSGNSHYAYINASDVINNVQAGYAAVFTDASTGSTSFSCYDGSSSVGHPRDHSFGRLRITRVGVTLTIYVKDGEEDDWTLVTTNGSSTTGDVELTFICQCNGSSEGTTALTWFDARLNEGVLVNAYRQQDIPAYGGNIQDTLFSRVVHYDGTTPSDIEYVDGPFDGVGAIRLHRHEQNQLRINRPIDNFWGDSGRSIEVWFKPNSTMMDGWEGGRLITKDAGDAGGIVGAARGWGISVHGRNKRLQFFCRYDNGSATSVGVWYTQNGTVHMDEWNHLIITYALGTDQVPSMILNGLPSLTGASQPTSGHDNYDDSNADMYIGNQDQADAHGDVFYDGDIGPITFYPCRINQNFPKVLEHFRMGPGFGPVHDVLIEQRPKSWWRMSEVPTLYDLTGTADGTYNDASPRPGRQAPSDSRIKVGEFQSVNDHYATVPHNSAWNQSNFTVSFWIIDSDGAPGQILTKGGTPWQWSIHRSATGIAVSQWQSGGANYRGLTSNVQMEQGVPYHVAACVSVGHAKIYIDGFLEVVETSSSGTFNTTGTHDLWIGRRVDSGGAGQKNMVISDICYFNRELTAEEIRAQYEATDVGVYGRGALTNAKYVWNFELNTPDNTPGSQMRDVRERGTVTMQNGPYIPYYNALGNLEQGRAIYFKSALNHYFTLPSTSNLTYEYMSIEGLLRTDARHGAGKGSGAVWLSRPDSSSTYNFRLIEDVDGGSVQFSVRTASGVTTTEPVYLPVKMWVHVVATYDYRGQLCIYINGHRKAYTRGYQQEPLTTNSGQLVIGGGVDGNYISGQMGLLKLFDYALSEGEIKVLADKALGGEYSHFNTVMKLRPAGYWRMTARSASDDEPPMGFDPEANLPGVYTGTPVQDTWGPHYDTDEISSGMHFTGADYFSVPGYKGLAGNQWSLSVWMRTNALPESSGSDTIAHWGNSTGGGTNPGEQAYITIVQADNEYQGKIMFNVNSSRHYSKRRWNDGLWHHLVFVCGDTTSSCKIYVDGVLDSDPLSVDTDVAVSVVTTVGNSQDFAIGVANPSGTPIGHIVGTFGEAALFARRLTQAEVTELYGKDQHDDYVDLAHEVLYDVRPATDSTHTVYLPFQESHGESTAFDASVNDFDGNQNMAVREGIQPFPARRNYLNEVMALEPEAYYPLKPVDGAGPSDPMTEDRGLWTFYLTDDAPDTYVAEFTGKGIKLTAGSDSTTTTTRGVYGAWPTQVSGDFDVQISVSNFNPDNTNDVFFRFYALTMDGTSGPYMTIRRTVGASNQYQGSNASTTTSVGRTSDYGHLRIVRTGSSVSVYYDDGPVSAWQTLLSGGTMTTADVFFVFTLRLGTDLADAREASCIVHDFTINSSGSLVQPGMAPQYLPWRTPARHIGGSIGTSPVVGVEGSTYFNGTSDCLRGYGVVPDSAFSDDVGSMACWFRIDPSASSGGVIWTIGSRASAGSPWQRIQIGLTETGFYPYVLFSNDSNQNRIEVQVAPTKGEWHHFAAISQDTVYQIYIDGRQQTLAIGEGSNNGNWLGQCTSQNNHTSIGAVFTEFDNLTTDTAHFHGEIAHLQYHSTAYTTKLWSQQFSYKRDIYPVAPTGSKRYNYFTGYENSNVTCGDVLDLNSAVGLTLAAWIYPDPNCATNAAIISKGASSGSNGTYHLQLSGGDFRRIRFTFANSGGSTNYSLYSQDLGFDLRDGWHHVCVSHYFGSPDAQLLTRLYVDGKCVGGVWDNSAVATASFTDGSNLRIGARSADQSYPFKGGMQHVIVHGRYFSYGDASKLAKAYTYMDAVRDMGAYMHFRLDDNGGTTTNKALEALYNQGTPTYTDDTPLGHPSILPNGEGQAYGFEGAGAYNLDSLAEDFNDSPEITVAFWAKIKHRTNTYDPYVMYQRSGGNEGFRIVNYGGDETVTWQVYQNGTNAFIYTPALPGQVHFLVFQYSATNQRIRTYLNGEFYKEVEYTETFQGWDTANDLKIGDCPDYYSPNTFLNEPMQEVSFFLEELTAEQIYNLYEAAQPPGYTRDMTKAYEQFSVYGRNLFCRGTAPDNLGRDSNTGQHPRYAPLVVGNPPLMDDDNTHLPCVHFRSGGRYEWENNSGLNMASGRTQFTVEMVVKAGNDRDSTEHYIAGHSSTYCANGWNVSYVNDREFVQIRWRDLATTSLFVGLPYGSCPLNTWHHIVFTLDTTADVAKAYLNGELLRTSDASALGIFNPPEQKPMIGAVYYDNQHRHHGDIRFAYFSWRNDGVDTDETVLHKYNLIKHALEG